MPNPRPRPSERTDESAGSASLSARECSTGPPLVGSDPCSLRYKMLYRRELERYDSCPVQLYRVKHCTCIVPNHIPPRHSEAQHPVRNQLNSSLPFPARPMACLAPPRASQNQTDRRRPSWTCSAAGASSNSLSVISERDSLLSPAATRKRLVFRHA